MKPRLMERSEYKSLAEFTPLLSCESKKGGSVRPCRFASQSEAAGAH